MPSVTLDQSTEMDITCNKGDTFELEFQFFSAPNIPQDLVGHTFRMHVRDSRDVLKLQFATGGEGIVIEDGAIRLYKTAVQMGVIPAGLYSYDLDQVYPDATTIKQFRGKFTVNRDVTP